VETNDIQGNIVAGFNTRFETFVALAFRAGTDRVKGARWIGSLAPQVSTVDDVRGLREAMKDPGENAAPWLAVAIGKNVLDAVQPSVMLDDLHFNRGMELSKLAIGDETLPADWVIGGSNHPVDLLLIIAANDRAPVEARADDLAQQAALAGLDVTYRETGVRLKNEIEHFGFKDGVSQPEIAGDRSPSFRLRIPWTQWPDSKEPNRPDWVDEKWVTPCFSKTGAGCKRFSRVLCRGERPLVASMAGPDAATSGGADCRSLALRRTRLGHGPD
jgi:deferrochelatase/peroxidase EfeB